MFTLAHLSDLHMAVEPHGSQLLSKRGLGYINWLRKRQKIHRPEVLDALVTRPEDAKFRSRRGDGRPRQFLAARRIRSRPRMAGGVGQSARRHGDAGQSRRLCPRRRGHACAILGRLHARRRRPRPFSVSAPARRRSADRAVDRRGDRAVHGDRAAWHPAAFSTSPRYSDKHAMPFASCSSTIRRKARCGATCGG